MAALPSPPFVADEDPDGAPAGGWGSIRRAVRAAAFWLAVMLPFLYVPLLAAGVGTVGARRALLLLVGLNGVALYVGRGHRAAPD